jgi:tetratricopeptide (TPR) repeat protein
VSLGITHEHALAYRPVVGGWIARSAGRWASSLSTALLLCTSHAARAEPPTPAQEQAGAEHAPSQNAPPEALAHYELGRGHFREGRYKEAIVELKAALALDPTSPNLMYNVAYTSELLGSLQEAIDYYEKYLAVLPATETKEREKIQVTLRRLEGRLAEHPAATGALPPPAPRAIGRADFWFWASLGAGGALLAGGAVTGALALQHEHAVKVFVAGPDGTLADRSALVDRTHVLALSSDIMTGAGAALVVTSALLFFLREPRAPAQSEAPVATVAADRHTLSLSLTGKF